ncbi:MAG: chromate transporter, partial [Synergistales bacterium]|nr:chromate transporter [Synergistales bacterium]
MSSLPVLFITFVRIGLGAFGGGLATIPFIHYELVVSNPWLTEREFSDVVSLAQMTPGPVAVNAATFVGYRIAGLAGSIAATTGVV